MKIFEADLSTDEISLLMGNANQEDLKQLLDYNLKAKQDSLYAVGKVDIAISLNRQVNFLGIPDLGKEEVIWIRNAGEQQNPTQCVSTFLKIKNKLCDFAKTGQHLPEAITIK
ncbi:MAG: hypothetical protein N4S00_01370 [Lactobacillus crispatus]|nr:hypothetical protein [Lactobacillus crispatus]